LILITATVLQKRAPFFVYEQGDQIGRIFTYILGDCFLKKFWPMPLFLISTHEQCILSH
jgi:hypothetical protein